MQPFRLYLFKEKGLKIRKIDIYNFFLEYQEVTAEKIDNTLLKLTYVNSAVGCTFEVHLCESLMVPQISKLDSSYLSLSAYIEIPITTPDFSADKIFEIIKKMSARLSICLYNPMFENIIPFRSNVVRRAFNTFKEGFKKNCAEKYNSFYIMDKTKLTACLQYQDQQYDVQIYFKESGNMIKAPNCLFLENNYRPYIAIEWDENEEIMFPPRLDFIYYITSEGVTIYYAKDFLDAINKLLVPFTGVIGAKIIYAKNLKKVKKCMKKGKLMPADLDLKPIRLNEIIDF